MSSCAFQTRGLNWTNHFLLSLQSLLVSVVAVFNVNQALAKLHNSQELGGGTDYRRFFERKHRDQPTRGKSRSQTKCKRCRRVFDFCVQPRKEGLQNKTMQSPCEAGWYPCHGSAETVCKNRSLACLSSLAKIGSSLCVPQYEWVTIELGTEGKRRVRRTKTCNCTQDYTNADAC